MVTRIIPDPNGFKRWQDWAQAYESQLLSNAKGQEVQDPQPVLLAHQMGMVNGRLNERAAVDGIVMWRPDTKELVVSNNGEWLPIANSQTMLEWIGANFVFAGFGTMRLPSSPVAIADLDSAWQDINHGEQFANSQQISFPGDGKIVFEKPGTYFISIAIYIEHSNSPSKRSFEARLRNVTQGSVFSLSYTNDTDKASTENKLNVMLSFHLDPLYVGDEWVFQFSCSDGTISNVDLYRYWVFISKVAPMADPTEAVDLMLPNFGDYYA